MAKSKAKRAARGSRRRPPRARPDPQIDAPLPRGLTIVGIGASAGGLEALTKLIAALPSSPGLVIVIVQHMAADHESALPQLLGGHTAMPVVQVVNGVEMRADHIYVIPPNVQMRMAGNRLMLTPRPQTRLRHTPIDGFFYSLAEVAGRSAIAVVLSGTASDGALGIRDVKAAGGITIAQQPESAKFDGMPRAAIATGMVDLVLEPGAIGAELARIARHPYVRPEHEPSPNEISAENLQRIFELLAPISSIDFRHYKQPTIRRRLMRRMALQRIDNAEDYITLLHGNPGELRGLLQDLLIHVTRFFREPESFAAVAEMVIPELLKDRAVDQPLRFWVCGCASGEEAYSLAIIALEALESANSEVRVQIFGTDVSEAAIEQARSGVYPAAITADVGATRLRRFFTRTDGQYRVSKRLRDVCVFARQDLTKDPPFSRLDLIMCRNVLIYMDATLQRRLIAMFHYALRPSGYLVLGHAETVGAEASLFSMADKKHRIHRRKSGPSTHPVAARPSDQSSPLRPGVPARDGQPQRSLDSETSRAILDRYAPPAVVVDEDWQIIQFRGQTGLFLEPAPGDASLNVLKMAKEGLLHGLRLALSSARKSQKEVRRDGMHVQDGSHWRSVAVEVVPLTAGGRPHYLVLFDSVAEAGKRTAPQVYKRKTKRKTPTRVAPKVERLEILQRELAASREYLQAIIQELEAANEELQSANEEILSSNEELQSTNEELDTAKEELQSTNEELNTVNDELRSRNDEISLANSDLVNLLNSVHITIVIVGSDLRIRRFTPMAEKVLNLIPADIGRVFGHINPAIDCPNLDQLILECIETVAPLERDVRDRQGRWYSLRIRPYKNLDNKIDGAVVALFDVDMLKRADPPPVETGR